ncbi:hypothetical protein RRG08_040954 [Elysia crispata]|uniref:Uncharacterized protein n=1 Tax=Elysia crispata TaxID=231223 RepID=A0AAE1E0R8_9GAST|nr:hypothetical protein RRG08_040954 [Elysia crispata]
MFLNVNFGYFFSAKRSGSIKWPTKPEASSLYPHMIRTAVFKGFDILGVLISCVTSCAQTVCYDRMLS